MKTIEIRYVSFPSTEMGRLGFYQNPLPESKSCAEPRCYYESGKTWGYCHTSNPEEMDKLALQVGAMTREKFQGHRKNEGQKKWLDAYATY